MICRELGWDRLRTVPEYVKFGKDLRRQFRRLSRSFKLESCMRTGREQRKDLRKQEIQVVE